MAEELGEAHFIFLFRMREKPCIYRLSKGLCRQEQGKVSETCGIWQGFLSVARGVGSGGVAGTAQWLLGVTQARYLNPGTWAHVTAREFLKLCASVSFAIK